MPLVPIRRKANIQYIILNNIPPTAIAPMYAAEPRCPVIATSISPSSGTVMLEIMLGRAMSRICLFMDKEGEPESLCWNVLGCPTG